MFVTKTEKFSSEAGIKIFLVISALIGLAMGLSDSILANYFKEAYNVNAQERGFIELPRELPGVLSIVFIAALSFLKSKRIAFVAQMAAAFGLIVLGVWRPSFGVMLFFLFIFSSGMHMYVPLGDSIGLSLAKEQNMGLMMGRFNSIRMAFLMIAGIVTFIGFRVGWFTFETPVWVFIISAVFFVAAGILLFILAKMYDSRDNDEPLDNRFVFRKEYMRYYVICALFGSRKQIMFVYSPWVLIELLDFKADTMSILAVIGSLIGVFFMPVVGRWIDRFGVKKIMILEALAFVAIYVAYGILSRWVNTQAVVLTGLVMILVYLLNIVDKMTAQFGMVRAIYMRAIAIVPEDVTPSLSFGMSIDHVIGITGSFVCGAIWMNFGPEYVFVLAALVSLANLIVANGIKLPATVTEK